MFFTTLYCSEQKNRAKITTKWAQKISSREKSSPGWVIDKKLAPLRKSAIFENLTSCLRLWVWEVLYQFEASMTPLGFGGSNFRGPKGNFSHKSYTTKSVLSRHIKSRYECKSIQLFSPLVSKAPLKDLKASEGRAENFVSLSSLRVLSLLNLIPSQTSRATKSERLDKRKLSVSAIEVFRQELSFNGGDKAEFGIGFVNSTWQPKNQSNWFASACFVIFSAS